MTSRERAHDVMRDITNDDCELRSYEYGIQQIAAAIDAALAEVAAERDAYKRAKAENDERFMTERDAARDIIARTLSAVPVGYVPAHTPDNLPALVAALAAECGRLGAAADERDADAVRAFRMAPPPDLRPIYDERGNLVRLLLAGEVVE